MGRRFLPTAMTLQSQDIYHWPRRPDRAAPCEPTLIRVDVPAHRPAARIRLREVLREVLESWSDGFQQWQPWLETRCGPQWPGLLGKQALDLSLSYSGEVGWIGLLRGGWIGVDAMFIHPFPELDAVAGDFLGPDLQAEIRRSSDPAQAFALAWTDMEARLKGTKADLVEYHRRDAAGLTSCQSRTFILPERIALTVAWRCPRMQDSHRRLSEALGR